MVIITNNSELCGDSNQKSANNLNHKKIVKPTDVKLQSQKFFLIKVSVLEFLKKPYWLDLP